MTDRHTLEEVRDQLREEVREARGMLKDLQREIKEAKAVVPRLAQEQIEKEILKQVDLALEAVDKAKQDGVAKVLREFDRLGKLLLRKKDGTTPSVTEMIETIAMGEALRDSKGLVIVGMAQPGPGSVPRGCIAPGCSRTVHLSPGAQAAYTESQGKAVILCAECVGDAMEGGAEPKSVRVLES